jgi:hypothetical protein
VIDFKIYTSSNGPLSPEQLSEMAANEIITVSDTAPQPLRDQAHLFREEIEQVIAKYMRQGINSHLKYAIKQG